MNNEQWTLNSEHSLFTVQSSLFTIPNERGGSRHFGSDKFRTQWRVATLSKFVHCLLFAVHCSLFRDRECAHVPQQVGHIPDMPALPLPPKVCSNNLKAHVVILGPLIGGGLIPKGCEAELD
eukprot:4770600-Prymnesium_polylepis.1